MPIDLTRYVGQSPQVGMSAGQGIAESAARGWQSLAQGVEGTTRAIAGAMYAKEQQDKKAEAERKDARAASEISAAQTWLANQGTDLSLAIGNAADIETVEQAATDAEQRAAAYAETKTPSGFPQFSEEQSAEWWQTDGLPRFQRSLYELRARKSADLRRRDQQNAADEAYAAAADGLASDFEAGSAGGFDYRAKSVRDNVALLAGHGLLTAEEARTKGDEAVAKMGETAISRAIDRTANQPDWYDRLARYEQQLADVPLPDAAKDVLRTRLERTRELMTKQAASDHQREVNSLIDQADAAKERGDLLAAANAIDAAEQTDALRPSYLADAPAASRHALAARRADLLGTYDKRLTEADKAQADAWKGVQQSASDELARLVLDHSLGTLDTREARIQADALRPYLPASEYKELAGLMATPTALRKAALTHANQILSQFGGRVFIGDRDATADWRAYQRAQLAKDPEKLAAFDARVARQDQLAATVVRYAAQQADALDAKGVPVGQAMEQIRAGLQAYALQSAASRVDNLFFATGKEALEDAPKTYTKPLPVPKGAKAGKPAMPTQAELRYRLQMLEGAAKLRDEAMERNPAAAAWFQQPTILLPEVTE